MCSLCPGILQLQEVGSTLRRDVIHELPSKGAEMAGQELRTNIQTMSVRRDDRALLIFKLEIAEVSFFQVIFLTETVSF